MQRVVTGRAARRAAPILATALTPAVAALRQPEHRRVDLGEMPTGLVEQGSHMLPLERDRGAFRIVLVVSARPNPTTR
jgi:hypothetical protein